MSHTEYVLVLQPTWKLAQNDRQQPQTSGVFYNNFISFLFQIFQNFASLSYKTLTILQDQRTELFLDANRQKLAEKLRL